MSKRTGGSTDDLIIQAKITNRLLAAGLKEKMKQQELIALLATTGATNQEIADVLNTTTATVSTALQRLRKKGKKDQGKTEPTTDQA